MESQLITVIADSIEGAISVKNHIVTMTVTQTPSAVDVSDFIWMGNLWLHTVSVTIAAVSVMIAALTVLAVFVGILKYMDYRGWRKKMDGDVEDLVTVAYKKQRTETETKKPPPPEEGVDLQKSAAGDFRKIIKDYFSQDSRR